MNGGWRFATIGGIPISIDPGWLVAFLALSWSLATGILPGQVPGLERSAYWVLGVVGALALFGSVLLHELGHAVAARRYGIRVDGITLFIFGGVARLRDEPKRPLHEFIIAIAGPVVSVAIAVVALGLAQVTSGGPGALLSYLALTNAVLVGFNLIPGFPLDGGRVLRAGIWAATGNPDRATSVASLVGQGFALLLVGLGFFQLVGGQVSSAIWTGFIGFYLFNAAGSARGAMHISSGLKGVRVGDIMDTSPISLAPNVTLATFVRDIVIREGQPAAVLVVGEKPWGIVSVADARKVPVEAWETTPIAEVATRPPLVAITPNASAEQLLELLAEHPVNQVVVVDELGRLVGTVSRASLVSVLQLRRELPLLMGRPAKT